MRRRRRGGGRRLRKVVALLVTAPLAALLVWELAFLRIGALRDRSSVRTIEVPTPKGERELVVGPRNPYWTPIGAISPLVVRAVVTAEDAKFWQHGGFDWEQLHDSVEENLERGGYRRGGSTITMQLAKNLFLWRGKSLVRKLLEAYLTWRLERSLDKKRILELYLNVVEWGPGVYGIGEASRHYYGKPPSELGLGEAAMLAGILPSPLRWNPHRAPAFAVKRQQAVMARMLREGAVE